jgi:hypothetical protein
MLGILFLLSMLCRRLRGITNASCDASQAPDYKSIAEFRRVPRDAVTAVGAELVRMARQAGLVKGEWVAIYGLKFRALSSTQAVPERESSEALPGSVAKRRSTGRSQISSARLLAVEHSTFS